MKAPKLEHGVDLDGRVGVLLTTPFSKDLSERFNETLKTTLPRPDRQFRDHLGGWWVAQEHTRRALKLPLRYWGRVDVFGDPDEGDFQVDRTGLRTSQPTLF